MTENLQNNKITHLIFLKIHIFHIFMHIYFSTHLDSFYHLFLQVAVVIFAIVVFIQHFYDFITNIFSFSVM